MQQQTSVVRRGALRPTGWLLLAALALLCPAPAIAVPYPVPPFDFAAAPFAGRPDLFDPGDGVRPLDLLVIFIRLDGFDYGLRGERFVEERVFGAEPYAIPYYRGNSIAEYLRRASHGRVVLRPARETSGIADNGVIVVDGADAADDDPSNAEWRRLALELADPYFDYDAYDTHDNDRLSKRELLILAVVGHDGGGGQEGAIADSGDELDGVDFRGYTLVLVGGPTGSFMTWVHELMHAAYDHRDLYGFTIGRWDFMGPTVSLMEERFGPSAFSKLLLGWTAPTVVSRDGWHRLRRADVHEDMLLLYDPARGTDEYFLVQNRIAGDGGTDRNAPDSGLLIQRVDVSLWNTAHDSEPPVETMRPDGIRNVPGCTDSSTLVADTPAGATMLRVDRYRFPETTPFNVRLSRPGESDLEEIATVDSASGTELQLGDPLELAHGAGSEVSWRGNDWAASYFATELAADAARGRTTFRVRRVVGSLPAAPFAVVLGTGDDPPAVEVSGVSGSVWTLSDPLERDFGAGTRVAPPWSNWCLGSDATDAWDTADAAFASPDSFDAEWADGSAAAIHLYGIGPASETTEIYVDVPADGAGLYLERLPVLRLGGISLPTTVRWRGRNTGDATDTFRLRITDPEARVWASVDRTLDPGEEAGFDPAVRPTIPTPPPGLEVEYRASSSRDPSVVDTGILPVDWPFVEDVFSPHRVSSWRSTPPDPRIFATTVTGITRATAAVFRGSTGRHTISPLDDLDRIVVELPDLAVELPRLLPGDVAPPVSVPECGTLESYVLPGPFGPEGLEMRSVLDVRVVPGDDYDPPFDHLGLEGVSAPGATPRLLRRFDCPVGRVADTGSRNVRLRLRALMPRLQRYRYDVEAEYKAQILRVPGQSIYRDLAESGDGRGVPCAGGFFPICEPDAFGWVTTPLPPLRVLPPGCPADGCPDHFVFAWEVADALDVKFLAPPGTWIALLDAFGAFVAEAEPFQSDPKPPIDDLPLVRNGTEPAPPTPLVHVADLGATRLANAAPELPDPRPVLPPSPFVPDPPIRVRVPYELFVDQLAAGLYFLQVQVPPDFDLEAEPDPVSLSWRAIDLDGDGVPRGIDNCPDTFNPDQRDFDSDGVGDACDPDVDGDGLGDAVDACPMTPLGYLVDSTGCSLDQLCPCDGPPGAPWRNHGAFVSCVARESNRFKREGRISGSEKGAIVSQAAASSCGK